MRAIGEHEFNEWLQHPVTQEVRRWLDSRREDLKEDWEEGAFTAPSFEEASLKNVNAVGKCEAYYKAANLSFEQLSGDLYEQSERTGAPGRSDTHPAIPAGEAGGEDRDS